MTIVDNKIDNRIDNEIDSRIDNKYFKALQNKNDLKLLKDESLSFRYEVYVIAVYHHSSFAPKNWWTFICYVLGESEYLVL